MKNYIELQNLRKELKVTRKAVAEAIGLKNAVKLSKFEAGEEDKLTEEQINAYELFLESIPNKNRDSKSSTVKTELNVPTLEESKEKAKKDKEKRTSPPLKKLITKNEELKQISDSLVLPRNFITVDNIDLLNQCVQELSQEEVRILDTETYGSDSKQAKNPNLAKFCGLSLWLPTVDKGYWIPIASEYMKCLEPSIVRNALKPVLNNDSNRFGNSCFVQRKIRKNGIVTIEKIEVPYKLVTHNYKFDAHVMRHFGIDLPHAWFDTLICSWLLDENDDHNLKALWNKYCCKDISESADKFNKLFGSITMNKVYPNIATNYSIKDVKMTYELMLFQKEQLDNNKLCVKIADLFWNREMPVLSIAYAAEKQGLRVDVEYLRNIVSPKLHKECSEIYDKILEIYVREGLKVPENKIAAAMEEHRLRQIFKKDGVPYAVSKNVGFNLNSNPQKQELVWDMLKLTPPKQPSRKKEDIRSLNSKKVLKKIRKQHSIIELLMKYNTANKLASAFADALPKSVILCSDGVYRVFPNINSAGTKTGRQSCTNPNLQQMPARVGELIRNAFIAEEKRLLLAVDYNQQELRVLADISEDEVLTKAFFDKKDIHSLTASTVLSQQLSSFKKTLEQSIENLSKSNTEIAEISKLVAGVEKELYLISEDEINNRVKVLKAMPNEQLISEIQNRLDNLGYHFTYGQSYEIFEMIRNKLTRIVVSEKSDSKEVEKTVGIHPVEESINNFPYADPKYINSLYKMASSLPDETMLELSHFFEKQRKNAKILNFGIVYGMSKYGLADALEIDTDTAQSFITGYLSGYKGIMRTMYLTHEEMKKTTFVENKAGRKRRFYNEFDKMYNDKSMKWLLGSCQRQSFNFKVQSYSADMTKQAMIDVQPILERIGGIILMAIHDEILFSVPATITQNDIKELREAMQNAIPLCVPMTSDAEIGRKWGECKAVSEIADFLSLIEELDDSERNDNTTVLDEESGLDTSYFDTEGVKEDELNNANENAIMLKADKEDQVKMGIEMLQNEILTIKNKNIRDVITEVLQNAPTYFWEIPASSTGKHHPEYALKENGLVNHIRAGIMLIEDTFKNNTIMNVFFPEGHSELIKDCIRGAYLIHDCCKSGLDNVPVPHTCIEHPLLVKELTKKIKKSTIMKLSEQERSCLSYMMGAVEKHMGEWITDCKGNKILDTPKNGLEKFIHMVDYYASRKFLEVNFEVK